jgi:arylsulfatase A-like enzyme
VGPVKAESPVNPGAMGFDEWLSHDNFFELNPWLSRQGRKPEQFEGESSEIIVDEAIRFIARAKQAKKPFLAVVWFGSPHEPYSGLPQDLALYDNLPPHYRQRMVTVTSLTTGQPVKRPMDEVLRERYAEITAMDRAIGKLRTYLKDSALRENTLVWYCGDNGIPAEAAATTPFRGVKGQVYEGGVRVPGVIEWPGQIRQPRASDVNTVTSDILPTLCQLAGQALPNRPLDGVSLVPLIDGAMHERSSPICFWSYAGGRNAGRQPYIAPELQTGTTPLVKYQEGRLTRNFKNFHHPEVTEEDYLGPRAILDNRYKLVVSGSSRGEAAIELFDLRDDPAEKKNLAESMPQVTARLQRQLRDWQQSVLTSLTAADYRSQ